jgi:hypothetical protein
MKKLLTAVILILMVAFSVKAQVGQEKEIVKPSVVLGGFVHADALYDTRQVVEAREGYLLFYPKNIKLDKDGQDVNAHGSFNQYAMTARLVVKATGPDVLGAKATALIEGDFTGASNLENNGFRLRHAYAKLTWSRVTLLAGQYWHPLDVPEMLPNVLSLNTGAPFRSFSRQPQIRTDLKLGKFTLVLAATSQRDYVNTGPGTDSSSSVFQRNSGFPNLHAQIQYSEGRVFAGAGFDFKQVVPRLITDQKYEANEKVNCSSLTGFVKLSFKPVVIKAQAIYGQNLNDHLMLGGYGVSVIDPLTDRRTYVPLNYLSAWVGLTTTGQVVQYSLFAGFAKGFGANDSIIAPYIYARGIDRCGYRKADIDYVYRLSPMVSWYVGKMVFAAELELTSAAYGPADQYYRITESKEVTNLRTTVSMVYNF